MGHNRWRVAKWRKCGPFLIILAMLTNYCYDSMKRNYRKDMLLSGEGGVDVAFVRVSEGARSEERGVKRRE